ncbi:MAG TPA: sigma-70 family RNA polymerase sigma factor [Anaerolineales bacterium]
MVEPTQFPANLPDIDRQGFGSLAESHRRELRAHCYRMLGSVQEAEEMVQETFLRAWSRRETYEGRSTFRAWLYKIATNLCIDTLRQRPRRGLPITREGVSTLEQPIRASINEPIWLEPYPDDLPAPEESNPEARYSKNESIRLAFIASLHLLPPRQRAVLILRDVLDWQANEVAEALEQTVPSVKSALHRARSTLAKYQPTLHSESISTSVTNQAFSKQLDRYIQAWEAADVDALLSLLRDDSTFSMPPIPSWYQGLENIGGLVRKTIFSGHASGRWRLLPTRANAQPGFGLYKLNEGTKDYGGYGVQTITFDGDQITDITTFRNPALLALFKLPSTLKSQ